MQLNRLESARRRLVTERQARGQEPIINLVDTDFHANGLTPPPPIFAAAFTDWLATRRYEPDALGRLEARLAIARFYEQGGPVSSPGGQVEVNPDHILLTASSSEAYSLLFRTFAQAGDNVLLPQPGYPLFEDLCAYAGLEPRFYPLDHRRGWEPDLLVADNLADDRTRFIVVISPNNPTGAVMSAAGIAGLAAVAHRVGAGIIADEVFSEFLYGEAVLPRPAMIAPDLPVYTLNGISKLFASPDLKLGWILVSGPAASERTAQLELRADTYLSANTFSQFLLPRLFGGPGQGPGLGDFVRQMRDRCAVNRLVLVGTANRHGILAGVIGSSQVDLLVADGGIHLTLVLAQHRYPDDETLAVRILEDCGIYVHPGYLYGLGRRPGLVLSLLKEPALFAPAIERLFTYLMAWSG